MKKINPWLFSLLLVPYIIIFRAFFLKSVLAFGDAPYFFPQFLSQLLNIPFAWDARSTNLGGSSIQTLWLFMPTFLMGLFYNLSHFDSETLSKIIFYFPATILSIVGSYLLLGLFTKDKLARILGCFFYSFNSYFLILVDGGQVGVSLSYGIFPLAIYLYMRLTRDYKISSFVFCLISFFALSNIDLRVFIIFLATIFGVILSKRILNKTYTNFFKDAKLLALLTFCTLLLDGFWLLPLFFGLFNNQTSLSFESSNLVSIKLIDSLFFYQPHFPLNEFGNYANVPFYYVFLPVLILLGGFLSKGVKKISIFLSLIALILIFLTKGSGDPLGFIYQFLVDKVPFGVAFRDSSKLFIPLLLIGSILISINFNSLKASLKKTHYLVLGLIIYFYLLFLIYPAFLGGLRGTLNNPVSKADFDQVNQKIIDSSDFSRSVWFPEKPPLGYFDLNHPALSANTLYKLRPFASMIDGDYDFFYFLHSNQLVQWFNLLGIKYAAFPENERQKIYSSKQLAERRQFLDFVNLTPNFKKEKSNLPLYRIDGNKPHIFGQKKIYFVVGGEEIYQRLISLPNFNLAAQSFVFIEQGLLNRKDLENYLKMGNSALVYVNRSKIELALGLLSEKMISTVGVSGNSWSQKNPANIYSQKHF